MNWIPACAGMTCALDSRLRGNDLCTGFPPARERLARGSLRGSWWLIGPSFILVSLEDSYRCSYMSAIVGAGSLSARVTYRRSHLPSANTETFINGFVLFELSFQIELILNSITVRNS